MPQAQLQPAPFRVPLLDAQGQLAETWRRFFLSSQAIVNQILNGQIPLTPIGQGHALLQDDPAEDPFGWALPGPVGPPGPPGQPGPPPTLFEESVSEEPWPLLPMTPLPVLTGGTGTTTFTTDGVLYGAAALAVQATAQGPTNSVLTASAGAPSFSATPTVTTLTTTGAATIGGLTDLSGASAGQVKFPATQNASTNANTLDDYEEGTWTPNDASGASLSFTLGTATYIKIGQLVTVQADITFPVTASGLQASFGGLPFTIQSGNWSGTVGYTTYGVAGAITVLGPGGGTAVVLYAFGGGAITNAAMSTMRIIWALTYQASA